MSQLTPSQHQEFRDSIVDALKKVESKEVPSLEESRLTRVESDLSQVRLRGNVVSRCLRLHSAGTQLSEEYCGSIPKGEIVPLSARWGKVVKRLATGNLPGQEHVEHTARYLGMTSEGLQVCSWTMTYAGCRRIIRHYEGNSPNIVSMLRAAQSTSVERVKETLDKMLEIGLLTW